MVITQKELIEKVQASGVEVDMKRFKHACEVCIEYHGSQLRASGEPYYSHPMEVTAILTEIKLDETTLITALLHDTVEDTDLTLEDIDKEFGEEVKTLVDGVTKLAKIEYQSEHTRQAENFRKLLVAMSEDIRVLLVKLADRLHNMRTLHYVKSPEKRMRIAHETMEIYAPLAERIGMQKLKNELQDHSFAQLHPEMRESIISRLEYLRSKGNMVVEAIQKEIEQILKKANKKFKIEIVGREKAPASIWRKMERKNISFEQLSDIMAFRIITEDLATCYQALGIIHTHYKMVPDRFKDFISIPKDNGYQSLHTVVIGPEQRFIEVQIRTQEMHEVAEFGVAAHWSYKQKRDYSTDGKQYKWVRELLYILEHASDMNEFFENTKLEMYYDQVFCFTPRGDLIALPRGATPVDFAYEVHSDIGNHCAGAKINGRIAPLRTLLENGDQIEIITSKTQVPSPSWEQFVITGKSKSEIRRFVRAQKRDEYIKLGKSLIEKTFTEAKKKMTKKTKELIVQYSNKKSLEDVYFSVGEGNISPDEVLRQTYPDEKLSKKRRNPLSMLRFSKNKKAKTNALPITGLIPGMAVYYAECCHPIPGDSIVGVVTTGKGMTIHTSDCEVLSNFTSTPERLVEVSWGKGGTDENFVSSVKVVLAHESGSLAALAEVISRTKGNINNLRITKRSSDFFEIIVDIGVKGTTQLEDIIKSMRATPMIQAVERFKKA